MSKNNSLSVKLAYFLTGGVFLSLFIWWLYNYFVLTPEHASNALLADTQWVLALTGGIIGIWAAQKWGGLKSVFGKSVFLLSAGLLAQVFGQIVYTYYARVQHVEAPYPSIGDIGFFGSVVFYIAAVYLLAKTAGASIKHTNTAKKLLSILLPAILLSASYVVFLKDYEVDWSAPLVVLLDFGYPLGQAIFVSMALLTYFLSRGLLGGIMKMRILLLLAALVVQYAADYSFLYMFNRETWYPGGVSDLIYIVAYLLMGVALVQLASVALSLSKNAEKADSEEVET